MRLDKDIAAIVTGGASGLGEATARALAATGVKVALFDLNAERGQQVADDIGGQFVAVDVTSDDSVAQAFATARAAHGQERILVNCAGIVAGAKTVGRNRETGAITGHSLALFEKVIQVNLIGTFRCIVAGATGMAGAAPLEDGERGVIINTASVAATDGQMGQAAYTASKAGILGISLPVARDLAGEGVRINSILPGIMETPMMAGMADNVRASLSASVPFPRRLGRPSEFASLALEICRNAYLNGESFRLDGAIRLAPR